MRSSCATPTTKRLLARLAASATPLAWCRSASVRLWAAISSSSSAVCRRLSSSAAPPALLRQGQQPHDHAGNDGQHQEGAPQGLGHRQTQCGIGAGGLQIDRAEQQRHQHAGNRKLGEEARQRLAEPPAQAMRHQPLQQGRKLCRIAGVRLAQIAAAHVERAAERADGAAIGRAVGHVGCGEADAADPAGRRVVRPGAAWLAREVEPPAGQQGQRRAGQQGGRQRHEWREGLCHHPETAGQGQHAQPDGGGHRADADRIDVEQMRALEVADARCQPQRAHQHQIGDQGADPGADHDGEAREHRGDRRIDAELDQQNGNRDVEHHPDHPSGMAPGQAREEVRPGDRAGIGVGDVDLELGGDDQQGRRRQCQGMMRRKLAEGVSIHRRWLRGEDRRRAAVEGQGRE